MNERSRTMLREAARMVTLSAGLLDAVTDDDDEDADPIAIAAVYAQLAIAAAVAAFVNDEDEPASDAFLQRMAKDVGDRIGEGEEPEAAFRNVVRAYNQQAPV